MCPPPPETDTHTQRVPSRVFQEVIDSALLLQPFWLGPPALVDGGGVGMGSGVGGGEAGSQPRTSAVGANLEPLAGRPDCSGTDLAAQVRHSHGDSSPPLLHSRHVDGRRLNCSRSGSSGGGDIKYSGYNRITAQSNSLVTTSC